MAHLASYRVGDIEEDLAKRLHHNHMEHLGIANTMKLAREFNSQRFEAQGAWRRSLYRERETLGTSSVKVHVVKEILEVS